MKKLLSILSLLIVLICNDLQAQNGQALLQDFLNNSTLKNAVVGIHVSESNSGKTLLTSTPQVCLTPASVMKLITTGTALDILGQEYKFRTSISHNGNIENRVLHGDLIITGGGDPTLGSENFVANDSSNFLTEWAKTIKDAGIDTITGNIVADPYIYTDQEVPVSWVWEDMGQYYGAAAQGISLYDNTFNIEFETGDTGSLSKINGTKPNIPGLSIQNEVVASDEQRDKAYIFGSPYNSHRIIRGTLPRNRKSYFVKSSVPDPALLLAHELKSALASTGVIVMGNPVRAEKKISAENANILFTHLSPSLNEIIIPLNQKSINLYSEHLCKHLGYVAQGEGSTLAGAKTIVEHLKSKGIDTSSLFVADGSGLSRYNAITAQTLTGFLVMMKQSPMFESFYKSIPLAGIEGTMQYYFKQSPLKGEARVKSGSMTRIRSFAGYFTTKNGTDIAFTIIVNNYSSSNANLIKHMEQFLSEIYLSL